jgi:RING-type zinc-finger
MSNRLPTALRFVEVQLEILAALKAYPNTQHPEIDKAVRYQNWTACHPLSTWKTQRIPKKKQTHGECPICFEPIHRPVQLPCRHTFCPPCIRKHKEAQNQRLNPFGWTPANTCPCCRHPIGIARPPPAYYPNNDWFDLDAGWQEADLYDFETL